MTTNATNARPARRPSLGDIRKAAGPNVDVTNDTEGGCYRATCKDGFAFENGALHELLAIWGDDGDMARARADLMERLSGPTGYVAYPCTDPECDWCHES